MNPHRVHQLVAKINTLILESYKEEKATGRDKVLEILNALANATAVVLAGTASDKAQEFFNDCLEQSIDAMIADRKKRAGELN